jgi:diguanylate cyclase (GGDEF)-like protein/PAS domain S-box-containing protein
MENTISLKAAYFRNISDSSPLGIFVTDPAEEWVYANAAYHRISGVSVNQTQGNSWSITIHPDDKQRVLSNWHKAAPEDMPFQSELRYLHPDGSVVWGRLNIAAMYEGKALTGYVQTVEDITERKSREARLHQAEDELYAEKERAQVTLNSIGDAVLATDDSGCISYLNKVAEDMTGWSSVEAMGKPIAEVFHIINGETREQAQNPADIVITEDRTIELAANCVLISKDGTESYIEDSAAPIHNRQGQVTGAVIVFHDVSVSRAMSSKMTHMAQHDTLTDLPNRVMLTERLTQAIGLAQRHDTQLGVMYLDLDLFKHVNDSLGHKVGDLLLQSVAKRLASSVRATDTVCRQGGDEFVILLVNMEDSQDATRIAESLLGAFASPHSIQGHLLYITLSIGISIYPEDGMTVDTMMQNADVAMYHAKNNGRNNFQFFKEEMNQRAVRRLFVINGLRRALKNKEFEMYYQPKFNLASGQLSGVEALLRWNDPKLGLVYPESFIDIAEESGLIVPLGQWIIVEACRQVQQWQEAGLAVVPVAVNVSAVEFYHKKYLAGIASALKETGLNPALLELELTESVLMDDAESSAEVLDALKLMGVSLAIDDFGTGYSSLSYLKRFPINTLKIDQTFVRDVTTDVDDATIVSAVIGMGKNLKQKVIAEGVETAQQLAFLKTRHCDEGQGYLLSHPLTADDFGQFLLTGGEPLNFLP